MIKTQRGISEMDTFTCGGCGVRYHKEFMSHHLNECKICIKIKGDNIVTNARVFVVNHIGKDMSDAMRFGTLIPITEGSINVFNTERVKYDIEETLKKHYFNFKDDYILLSGSTVLNFIIGMVTAQYGKINILIWDAKKQQYEAKEVKL